jgi:hypothetical protein
MLEVVEVDPLRALLGGADPHTEIPETADGHFTKVTKVTKATKPTKPTKTKKDTWGLFFVIFVDLVIFVDIAVARLSEA